MFAATIAVLVGAALGQPPPSPPAKPSQRTNDCTASGCHASQMNHAFLHGPTAVQACDACHQYADVAAHTFEMKRAGRELCAFCHIDQATTQGRVVHEPVAKGDCTGCHDSHGGAARTLLKKDPVPALCLECHKDVLKGAHAHGPAAMDCLACHKAHASDHERLLPAGKRDLCLMCHAEVGKQVAGMAHAHKPAEGDCLQCHAPHATDQVRALKLAPAELCVSCHQEVGKQAAGASHPHGALTDARSCLNCHTAHASDHAKQLSKDTIGSCLACHNKPIVVDKTRTVAGVADLGNAQMHKHGPIEKGECGACHTVHGGANAQLLVTPYPAAFYQKFTDEAYSLCFKCHDRGLAVQASAEKETGFRDGTRNLHYVHVTGPTQGRSCRACHSVHASRFEAQIAETVSYGQWKLPINFTPTATGGSCAPGCHKVQRYDRVAPIGPLPSVGAPPKAPAR